MTCEQSRPYGIDKSGSIMQSLCSLNNQEASRVLFRSLCLITVLYLGACSQTDKSNFTENTQSQISTARRESQANGICTILDRWHSGDASAVDQLVELAQDKNPLVCLRPFAETEAEVVAMGEAEREQYKKLLVDRINLLRGIVKEIDSRFHASLIAGDSEAASRYLNTVKRIAAANTGSEVNLLVDMVGTSFNKRAGMMQAARDGQVAQSTGPK